MDKLRYFNLDNLYYLGNRNYIQGGTIYEAVLPKILECFVGLKSLEFTFRAPIQMNLVFFGTQQNDMEIKVALKIESNVGVNRFYGYHGKKMIVERFSYDEEQILKTAEISGDMINLVEFSQSISVVRHCIAMNKKLLDSKFKVRGKWFLSRLMLNEIIDEDSMEMISLKYVSRFEFLIVKSEIFINNISVGFLYFSLKGEDYVS